MNAQEHIGRAEDLLRHAVCDSLLLGRPVIEPKRAGLIAAAQVHADLAAVLALLAVLDKTPLAGPDRDGDR